MVWVLLFNQRVRLPPSGGSWRRRRLMRGPPKGGKILDFANKTPHPPQAVPLKVNCRIAAREATLGCLLEEKVNFVVFTPRGGNSREAIHEISDFNSCRKAIHLQKGVMV